MIFIADRLWLDLAGGFLLVLPHALGAPHAASAATVPFPPGMETQFIIASLATSLVFWLFLGGASGWIYRRLA
jgi:predicted cobalt transporter CbtA